MVFIYKILAMQTVISHMPLWDRIVKSTLYKQTVVRGLRIAKNYGGNICKLMAESGSAKYKFFLTSLLSYLS